MQKWIIASGNRHKLEEIGAILPANIELVPQGELSIPSPEETGLTFVENAILKARHAAALGGCPAIADDSGIEVAALDGAPGIYSARYAGPEATDEQNNNKLLAALEGITDRRARYVCVIVIMRHARDPYPVIASGTWAGEILHEPRGEGGFGYDPLFLLPDGRAVAQLEAAEKNRLSHRGQALAQLSAQLADDASWAQ